MKTAEGLQHQPKSSDATCLLASNNLLLGFKQGHEGEQSRGSRERQWVDRRLFSEISNFMFTHTNLLSLATALRNAPSALTVTGEGTAKKPRQIKYCLRPNCLQLASEINTFCNNFLLPHHPKSWGSISVEFWFQLARISAAPKFV